MANAAAVARAGLGPAVPEGPLTLTVSQFARALGVTPKTVRRWLYDGKIRGSKPAGGQQDLWRIPRSELERLAG